MSTAHVIQTIFEVLLIGAIIVCLCYEPAIEQWEKRQGEKMLKFFKKQKEIRK